MTRTDHVKKPPPPEAVNHYEIHFSCPLCGSLCVPVAEGSPVAGTEIRAIVRCSGGTCHREWQIIVHMRSIQHDRQDIEHGTHHGYVRHLRNHESACDACREAHAAYVSAKKHARKAEVA